ncbi:MAG: hypothetical protein ACOZNI_04300 [Myxococcota bacterium]
MIFLLGLATALPACWFEDDDDDGDDDVIIEDDDAGGEDDEGDGEEGDGTDGSDDGGGGDGSDDGSGGDEGALLNEGGYALPGDVAGTEYDFDLLGEDPIEGDLEGSLGGAGEDDEDDYDGPYGSQ